VGAERPRDRLSVLARRHLGLDLRRANGAASLSG